MSHDDLRRIAEARTHLEILRSQLTRADLGDSVIFDAVCLRPAAAIDCVGSIDATTRDDVRSRYRYAAPPAAIL